MVCAYAWRWRVTLASLALRSLRLLGSGAARSLASSSSTASVANLASFETLRSSQTLAVKATTACTGMPSCASITYLPSPTA